MCSGSSELSSKKLATLLERAHGEGEALRLCGEEKKKRRGGGEGKNGEDIQPPRWTCLANITKVPS